MNQAYPAPVKDGGGGNLILNAIVTVVQFLTFTLRG